MLIYRVTPIATILAVLATLACQAAEQTVPGPEAQDLTQRIEGHLVWSPLPNDQIVAISLPSGKRTTVVPAAPENKNDTPRIHSLSGPDDEGRVAYVEDHFFVANDADKRHLLKIVQLDGTGDATLFTRPGDAMWATSAAGKGEIGEHLALAPTGGHVAFLSGLKGKQMPSALLQQGAIEIWSISEKKQLTFRTKALDMPMSWFPAGKHLAYVNLVKRDDLPKTGVDVALFGKGSYTGNWSELPAIHILDLDSGKSRCLSLGWSPVVSADSKSVYVGGWVAAGDDEVKRVWKRVDVDTGAVTDANWPGDANGLIANPTDDLVLYWGLPTAGEPVKRSQRGSFRRGLQLLTLKAAALNTGRFQTVIPEIDPRDKISFGSVKQQ